MKQTFLNQSLSVRLRWVVVNETLTRVWNPGFYYSFVSFSVSWIGYGKQQKLKKQKNNETRLRVDGLSAQTCALKFSDSYQHSEVVTWSCLKPQFMYSVHCFVKDTNRPEQEYMFLFSKTVFFAWFNQGEAIISALFIPGRVGIERCVAGVWTGSWHRWTWIAKKVSQGKKQQAVLAFMFEWLFENGHR